jgi:hypothetical protein
LRWMAVDGDRQFCLSQNRRSSPEELLRESVEWQQ